MGRGIKVWIGLAATLLLVAAGIIIGNNNSKAKYDIFQEQRGLFEAVKEETGLLMKSIDDRSNVRNTFIYSSNGNTAAHQFHEGANADLQDKVRQIAAVSGDELNFVRYSRQDGEDLLRFVFNWERERGNTYHIVYCESQSMVERAYEEEPVQYKLAKLADGWYGIEIQ
ncbi:hypothetical protein HQN87_14225 [Paenibacillus tritici]|uniref:DUF4362 domain-containing protein n=1 Tax=Paenibacillus tritici TaxID=1873425 RepID=A0ABX2DPZ3_9BACL|nr:hypothetical protein [Paenibacillus tritici]NQX46495.1 hypothetical protein [Paenibacillus tritici]